MVYGMKNMVVNRQRFKKRFGFNITDFYGDIIHRLINEGKLIWDDENLRITKDYYIFADDICREFFLPEYENMMLAHVPRG
jgi:hypothetical protein